MTVKLRIEFHIWLLYAIFSGTRLSSLTMYYFIFMSAPI